MLCFYVHIGKLKNVRNSQHIILNSAQKRLSFIFSLFETKVTLLTICINKKHF